MGKSHRYNPIAALYRVRGSPHRAVSPAHIGGVPMSTDRSATGEKAALGGLAEADRSASHAISRMTMMAGIASAGFAGIVACSGGSNASAVPTMAPSTGDPSIINAAATAEALASVMYDNIIKMSPAYQKLGALNNVNDQAYLVAGREQEAIHYQTLVAAGAKPLTQTFYFPTNMFSDTAYATTVNTLTLLEDAFIAAYLIGIRDLSTNALKQLAGQILGVESEHRAFARVIASDLGLNSTTGLSGTAEPTNGPNNAANNLAFERTFSNKFMTINDVVTALGPFVNPGAQGFSTTAYAFNTASNYYLSETPMVTLSNTTP
jgi:hypothetical protein